ncbi:neogenin-like isoform X1 [Haliotis rubra]|uniref:neogenin-like isoform X1 n=1 Tax=Haliotis rubra TaxID=36100 RepID=UPI001EE531D0|nr:neogenin-like isoform X1 [Haliotis rubra]
MWFRVDACLLGIVVCVVDILTERVASVKLPQPEIISTSVVSPSEILVRWHDPGLGEFQQLDGRQYNIKYHKHQHRGHRLQVSGVKDTRAVITRLQSNTTYVFRVKTVKGQGSSAWSDTAVNRTYPLDTFVQVEATTVTSTSIIVAWTLPRKHVNTSLDYTIFWSEEQQEANTVKVSAESRSHLFDNLIPGRRYNFRLVSKANGDSVVSTATVSTATFTDRPSKPPRNLKLQVQGQGVVRVSWSPPPARKRHGIITQYKIQYKRRGSRRGDVCTVMTSRKPLEYILTDLEESATYRVRVAARTVNGTGPYSKWGSVDTEGGRVGGEDVDTDGRRRGNRKSRKGKRKGSKNRADSDTPSTTAMVSTESVYPGIPDNLHVVDVASTSVGLRWTAPVVPECCPLVAYRILVQDMTVNQLERDIVTGTNTETVIELLDPGTLYAINITSFNVRRSSEQSPMVYVTTSPAVFPVMQVFGGTVLVGGRANLTCIVRGDPIPTVSWYRQGMMAPFYEQRSLNMLVHAQHDVMVIKQIHLAQRRIESHLIIDAVQLQHSGNYICSAESDPAVNATVQLHVHALPRFLEVERKHAVVSQAAAVSCVVSGVPLPHVVWSRFEDGLIFHDKEAGSRVYVTSSVDEETHIVNKTLHFSALRLSDEGNYTCQAKRGEYSTWRVVPLTLEVPPPPPVSNIQAVAVSPSKISIVWEDPIDYKFPITAYNIIYRPGRSRRLRTVNTTSRRLEIGDLHPNLTYTMSVRAINTHGVGKISPQVEARTLPNTDLQPANVSAVALNSSMIQLEWEAPSHIDPIYIQGYTIYYKRMNDSRSEKLFLAGNRNKQFLVGLGQEDNFVLRIATVLTWGEEAPSREIRIRKSASERVPPPAPRRLVATPSTNSIQLTWRAPVIPAGRTDMQVRGYKVRYQMGLVRGFPEREVRVPDRLLTYTLGNLASGQVYRVMVAAFNEQGDSRFISVTTRTEDAGPGPVVGATTTPMSSSEILVQWLAPSRGHVTHYHVRYWRPGKRDKQSATLYIPNTQYIAGSLRKFSKYRFEIIPYNDQQIGEVVVVYASTMIDRPDAPPRKVDMTAINATALLVNWEPPLKANQNGPISGYKLVLKKKAGKRMASFNVAGGRRNYTFKNLEPGTAYRVRVSAMNIRGTGPSSSWSMERTDKIEQRPPASPAAMDTNVTSSRIHVTWKPPRDIGVPVLGYILGYGRYIPEVYRHVLSPGTRNFTLTNLEPDTGYIVSVRAYNNIGESLPKFVVGRTGKADPKDLPIKISLKMRAATLSASQIQITWNTVTPDLKKKVTSDIYFLIRFSALEESEYQYLNTSGIPVTIDNLHAGTKYEFAVKALRGSKETGWSLPVYNNTFQTVPTSPSNLTVTSDPVTHTTLTLTWIPPKTAVNGFLIYAATDPSLNIRDWDLTVWPGSRDSMRVQKVKPHTKYYFHIQSRNSAGTSPLSERVTYSPPEDPRTAPSDISLHPLYGSKSTTVEVTWSPPVVPSGPIVSYVVLYTTAADNSEAVWEEKTEESLSCLLIGLNYNATYRIKVKARYSGGVLGPASPVLSYSTLSYSDIEKRQLGRMSTDTSPVTTPRPGHVARRTTSTPQTLYVGVRVTATWHDTPRHQERATPGDRQHQGTQLEPNATPRQTNGTSKQMEHQNNSMEHHARQMEHQNNSMEHHARQMEHQNNSMEHHARQMEHQNNSMEHHEHQNRQMEHQNNSMEHHARQMAHQNNSMEHHARQMEHQNNSMEHHARQTEHQKNLMEHHVNLTEHHNNLMEHPQLGRYKTLTHHTSSA